MTNKELQENAKALMELTAKAGDTTMIGRRELEEIREKIDDMEKGINNTILLYNTVSDIKANLQLLFKQIVKMNLPKDAVHQIDTDIHTAIAEAVRVALEGEVTNR